jgi:CBS domain-containing protein
MLAKDLINDRIPSLRPSDTGLKAMRLMEKFAVEHLPVTENTRYLGVVPKENILIKLSALEAPLEDNKLLIIHKPAVLESQPLIDVVKLMSKEKMAAVAVLDSKDNYLGMVTLEDVIRYYHDSGMLKGPGGMIVLEMRTNDYSLSEISRLVENENGKIYNVSVAHSGEGDMVDITLKFNLSDLSRIISAFERHGYNIKESHHQTEFVEDLQSRYDMLMNFLDI